MILAAFVVKIPRHSFLLIVFSANSYAIEGGTSVASPGACFNHHYQSHNLRLLMPANQ
jgi:hypothetical protein